jgi:toxin ParE1/3/4
MSRAVVLRAEAKREFDEAFDWYEQRRAGLGRDFVACVEEAFDRIAKTPELFATVFRDVRRTGVHRFPYSVYFLVEGDKITVIAVFHAHRDPTVWQSRV